MAERLLRILSGSHEGAELTLEPGSYLLGQNDDCDLALMDEGLADEQLVIEISDTGIAIHNRAPDTQIFINGQPADTDASLNHFDIVTIAGLNFAFGPENEEWPELTIPQPGEAPAPENADDEPPILEDETSLEEGTEPEEASEAEDDSDEAEEEEEAAPRKKAKKAANTSFLQGLPNFGNLLSGFNGLSLGDIKQHIKSNPTLWGFGTGIGFLLVGTTSFFIAAFSGPEIAPKPPVDYQQVARAIKQQYAFNDIKIESLPDSSWISVSGYVSSQEQKELLEGELQTNEVPFNSQIVVIPEMLANAEAVLKLYGYKELEFQSGPQAGVLVLYGYTEKARDTESIKMLLKQEVHGLLSVIDKVEDQSSRMKLLKGMLAEVGLARNIHVIKQPGLLVVRGTVSNPEEYARLKNVIADFRARYGDMPKLKVSTKARRHIPRNKRPRHPSGRNMASTPQGASAPMVPSAPGQPMQATPSGQQQVRGNSAASSQSQQPSPDNSPAFSNDPYFGMPAPQQQEFPVLNIRGVNMGAIPYVILGNGGKYLPGAQLPNGYILEDIQLEYLILSNGINRIRYPLGGYHGNGR
ncbi:type III secretion system inner membrane ring subunit SctD [Spongorhabdus nitratireducens]